MADRVTVLGFATAHVTGLTVLSVLALHTSSSLGAFLEPVGTVIGSLLFGVLWAVAAVTHYYGFETADPWSIKTRRALARFLGTGFVWGALTGVGTFWGLAVVGILGIALSDPVAIVELFGISTVLIALLGTGISLIIGGVVGVVAAGFDISVLSVVKHCVRED